MSLTDFQAEVAELIIETLNLDIETDEIDPEDYLFGEGLAMDSIDALELAMAITNKYGFKLRSDDANNHKIFRSLRNLADYITQHAQ